ncbi:type I methionyl aminopeptidase [Curvivirga aplysinae]|uniref:type I methionyl aminopeptidase n=1 Tax=Curvivirga aplysinae TaxID=2529852 RepID=UPI0012BD273E|nr:type I methionyl aminopeptidase [Curvivirga aplysinae]MTI08312.1 type I methionyl aminopeptidase [Curvivirga aplysinae]
MVKTEDEIALMRISGRLLASVFEMLDTLSLEGLSTMEINDVVERFITYDLDARPASKGQYGYKYVLNCSINNVVCHGLPSTTEIIQNGDIINLDITLEKNGYIADSSKTYMIGDVKPAARRLVKIAQEAMWQGIKQVKPNAHLGDIGFAISRHAKQHGYSAVREYCGHGIGREMHEKPDILNFGHRGTGLKLQKGMVFTVEPMINQGRRTVITEDDGWTVRTTDKKLSAQFEHTVAVTETGVEILTLRSDETHFMSGSP